MELWIMSYKLPYNSWYILTVSCTKLWYSSTFTWRLRYSNKNYSTFELTVFGSIIYLSISFFCSRDWLLLEKKIECQRGMDSKSMRMRLGIFKLDSPKFHPAVSNLNKKSSNLFSISDKLCFSQWNTLSLFFKLSFMFSYNQYACQRHLNTSLLVAFTCIISLTEIK